MLISNPLIVNPDPCHRQDPVLLLQPSRVQLAIRDDLPEYKAQGDSQEPCDEEDDLPRLDGRPVLVSSLCNAICDEPAQDLAPAVEAEPVVDSISLFGLGIPLWTR